MQILKPGNVLPLTNIPTGTFIHNVELYPGKRRPIGTSPAGNMAQLMAKENGMALLRLPSGELRNVSALCMATVGQVSNTDHENVKLVRLAVNVTLALDQPFVVLL